MQPISDSNDAPSGSTFPKPNGAVVRPNRITPNDICQVGRNVFNLAAGYAASAASEKLLEKVGSFVDSRARLFEGLEKFLPPPIPGVARGPKRLRDKEYIWISEWCETNGFKEWGMRPRTFVILHMMGCPEAVDGFVEDNLYDIAIPYTEENLPRVIKGSKRKEFIDYQQHVLTAHAKDLEADGKHQHVDASADSFFWTERELGSGGFGVVDYVISRQSLQPFARKRIARGRSFKKDRDAIRTFENELKNLKLLSHRHLVRLIGSYTDRKYVGLIMTPVADMDLDTFMSSTQIDPVDRQNCLRRFYGCLATAVEYLHLNHIRHKDIKPKNALVKDRQILLTDFGTSLNWADDARSTTSGTNKQAFTKAYCAPEVYMHGSRNHSSDIWSLGCVFFDMSTVLAGFSILDRKSFFQSHGTTNLYVRDNEPATKVWMEELKVQASRPDDNQILDLILSMCHVQQDERPTATEVVSEILDFDGLPYYGFCCDRNDTHRSLGKDPDNTTTFYENETVTACPKPSASDSVEAPRLLLGPDATYKAPSVQEIEDGMTIQDVIPDEKSLSGLNGASRAQSSPQIHADAELLTSKILIEPVSGDTNTHLESDDSISSTSPQTPAKRAPSAHYVPPAVQEIEDGMTIRHLIPDMESLRTAGESNPSSTTADLKPSSTPEVSLDDKQEAQTPPPTMNSTREVPSRLSPERPWKRASQECLRCLWPACNFAVDSGRVDNLKIHLRSVHGTHELAWTVLLPDANTSIRLSKSSVNRADEGDPFAQNVKAAIAAIKARRRSDVSGALEDSSSATAAASRLGSKPQDPVQRTVRFAGLPEELRPVAKNPERRSGSRSLHGGMGLAHLESEHVERLWQLSKDGQRPSETNSAVPDSSLVPSFFLASTNLFSNQEVDSLTGFRNFDSFGPKPLFVCGSLMFPSILKARAENYVTSEGVYSARLQRRLRTNGTDWAKINLSLQQAAESMTPAVITKHFLYKKRGFSPSVLTRSFDQHDTVYGFLIFGLSEDALACLDHMFSPENSGDLFVQSAGDTWPAGLSFGRQSVYATITVKGGKKEVVEADAFMASGLEDENMFYGQSKRPWDINRFVRGRSFRKLSSNRTGEAPWVDEEEQLANAMQIKFILHGDGLCDAIMNDNRDKLLEIIDQRVDVNAPCHLYGTALQAAAFKGNENVVDLLLQKGARVNAKGGQYQNALIAATVTGHENVAKILLKNRADVLADGGRYISALYQAVDFSDLNLAHALLEKGAWLSADYRELLDLAAEHGSRAMTRLLEEYDVKMLHLRPKPSAKDSDSDTDADSDAEKTIRPMAGTLQRVRENREDQIAINKAALIKQVGFKIMVLKGQKGKWTGIKGVQIFKSAIQAGMDENIVDRARPYLPLAQNALDWLMMAVNDMDEKNMESERRRRRAITDGAGRRRGRSNSSIAGDGQQHHPSVNMNVNRPPEGRRNTVFDLRLPTYSSTRLPTYSSLDLPQMVDVGSASSPATTTDTVCLTCDGRGGRLGTERKCYVCGGTGRPRRRIEVGRSRSETGDRQDAICESCHGKGHVFSGRDVCRVCAGSGGLGGASDSRSGGIRNGTDGPRAATREREDQANCDPPPPYTLS